MSVSIICACKNRIKSLTISLSSWLLFDEVKEVIIVDWNSDTSIDYLIHLDPRIIIIRVNDEEFFNQPQPLNLASKFATQENILKLDCDHILNPYYNFFDVHKLIDSDNFVSGVYRKNSDELLDSSEFIFPLYGVLYVNRKRFHEIGGFNEKMGKYYSVEDGELTIRLRSLGMKLHPLNLRSFCIIHIPHSDYVRIENFEGFKKDNDFMKEFDNQVELSEVENATKDLLKFRFISRSHSMKNVKSFIPPDIFQLSMNDPDAKINSNNYSPYVISNNNWEISNINERFYLAKNKL